PPLPTAVPPAPTKAAPVALAGLINRISAGDLMINGARPTEPFATRIVAGTVMATGDSGVDVQFGDASAFALGPHSTLDIQRFDAEAIELVVHGTIDIEVAPRAPGQRFTVIAGEHAIEVRGTHFRVSHEQSATTVACRHGLVAVADRAPKAGAGTALVGAARRVKVAAGAAIADARVVPLSVDELASLAQATPLRVPLWNPDTLVSASAPLAIGGAGGREVRVDGIEVGAAPVRVRVMPGRHTVESTDAAGRYRRAGWVDVAAPTPGAKPARLDIPAEPAPGAAAAAVAQRRTQLRAGIDKARLQVCMRRLAKAGLTGTYVQIEISVDAGGAVGFLNVLDTDLPSEPSSCVREVLADVRFRPGVAATWREKIDL
nr:FecR domain-containing protein [Deltaproteobacteria bacterium]